MHSTGMHSCLMTERQVSRSMWETICDAKASWLPECFNQTAKNTNSRFDYPRIPPPPPPKMKKLARNWHFEFWLLQTGLQLEYVETNRCIPTRIPSRCDVDGIFCFNISSHSSCMSEYWVTYKWVFLLISAERLFYFHIVCNGTLTSDEETLRR